MSESIIIISNDFSGGKLILETDTIYLFTDQEHLISKDLIISCQVSPLSLLSVLDKLKAQEPSGAPYITTEDTTKLNIFLQQRILQS